MGGTAERPNLRIAEIRVQDFRSVKDLWMPLGSTVVLLGENNSGKTSLLAALDVALGSSRGREDDLRRAAGVSRFVIDVRFEPASGDDFDEATQDVLGVGPVQLSGKPAFFAIRTKGELDPKRSEISLKRAFLKGWARERGDAEKLSELSTTQVSREHRELVTFSLLDARRDAIEQLRNRRTYWGQMLSDLHLAPDVQADIESALAVVRDRLHRESPPLAHIQSELQDVRQVIDHANLAVDVSALPADVADLLRGIELLFSETAQLPLPLAVQGMGTRSLSALLIFRAYVRSVLASAQGAGTLSVAAFEEPEVHLHPHAQRSVLAVIRQVPGQRLISTHSPYVAGVADVFDIRVCRRDGEGTRVAWIAEHDSSGRPTFKPEELSNLRRFVQLRHGEILFARVVGLFEGDTEEAALRTFAGAHWKNGADAAGVSLVNVGGAGNYKHVVTALQHLRIPWVIFSDGDQAGKQGLAAVGNALGRTLDEHSSEVVLLPNGHDFEAYVLAMGLRPHAERAIARFFGATALADYRTLNHGQKLSKNRGARDYSSPGWEDRLVHDFMAGHKGTYGAAFAEEVLADQPVPGHVRAFFERIDKLLAHARSS